MTDKDTSAFYDIKLERHTELLAQAAAEIARLRALMTVMSKDRCSHIIEHSVYPTPDEYEAGKARGFYLGPKITYTCGIHNLSMTDNRCPECDRAASSASASRE